MRFINHKQPIHKVHVGETLVFEPISCNQSTAIKRAKVYGGWLVIAVEDVQSNIPNCHLTGQGYEWRTSITFVPDKKHKWRLY